MPVAAKQPIGLKAGSLTANTTFTWPTAGSHLIHTHLSFQKPRLLPSNHWAPSKPSHFSLVPQKLAPLVWPLHSPAYSSGQTEHLVTVSQALPWAFLQALCTLMHVCDLWLIHTKLWTPWKQCLFNSLWCCAGKCLTTYSLNHFCVIYMHVHLL